MWSQGTIDSYAYWVKHYEETSQFGIDGGKISKLSIRKNGKELYNYDRGLDFNKLDASGRLVFATLLEKYN